MTAAHRALIEDSRLVRAPSTEFTYGEALDSEKATISPKDGTFFSISGVQLRVIVAPIARYASSLALTRATASAGIDQRCSPT